MLIGTTQTVPAQVTARAYLRGLDRYAGRYRPPRLGLATLIYPAKDRETALREARAGIEEKYKRGRAFLPPAVTLAEKAAFICLHCGTAEQITESIAAQPLVLVRDPADGADRAVLRDLRAAGRRARVVHPGGRPGPWLGRDDFWGGNRRPARLKFVSASAGQFNGLLIRLAGGGGQGLVVICRSRQATGTPTRQCDRGP